MSKEILGTMYCTVVWVKQPHEQDIIYNVGARGIGEEGSEVGSVQFSQGSGGLGRDGEESLGF